MSINNLALTKTHALTLAQWRSVLSKKYHVLDFVDLNDFVHPSHLFDQVKKCKKETFADNEKIIFVYSKNKIDFLLDLIETFDIPDFFVILLVPDQAELNIRGHEIELLKCKDITLTNDKKFDVPGNLCIYPWVNLTIDNLGDVSPCCVIEEQSISFYDKSLKDIYLDTAWRELRKSFRENDQPSQCKDCWTRERTGNSSMRTFAKSKFKELWLKIDYSQDDIDNLKMFDLKLGNSCNLSCNICNPKSSSKVANIRVSSDIISNDEFQRISRLVNWNTSDSFKHQIIQLADNLLYLDIYGGEPFMNKAHFVLLNHLIELGVAKNIAIDYNTNGTIYSEKFFELWKEFKSVKISFSIDDIGDRFEFQRAGADWASVCDNIAKYNQKTDSNFVTDIFATVNAQNVYYLPELLDWATQQQCSQNITFNILTLPPFFAINNLPMQVKLTVQQKLKNHTELQPIINFMFQDATSNHDVLAYLQSLKNDQGRGYFEVHEEFANVVAGNL